MQSPRATSGQPAARPEVGGVKVPFTVKLHSGHFVLTFTEIKNGEPLEGTRFCRPSVRPRFR